jgi:hypothetical protein
LKLRGASITAPHLVILTLAAFSAASEGPKSGALSAFPCFPFVKLPTSTVAKVIACTMPIRRVGMYMILGWLEEIKIQRTAERWFSTSFSGGFGPKISSALPLP